MKTLLFLVSLLSLQIPLSAQENEPIDLKEYFMDAEYFFAQEEYLDALYDYLEVYNNGYSDNANINYRIGICYLNIPGQKDKSINYLLEALKNVSPKYRESTLKQTYAPIDAHLYLGNAYRVNNLLSKAIESYNTYKELAGQSGEIKYADQQIAACNNAIRFMDSPLQLTMTNLGDSVNGSSSNFKAVISGDGLTLAFMNELPFYQAVYVSRYTGTGWAAPVNITPQIQSDGDQYVSSISYDGTRLYLTREDAFNSDVYTTDFQNGKWTKSQPITGQYINTKYWESHASISRDGKTLYFTSNRKDGFGEMDIYRSVLQPNGQWGSPVNLGNGINTNLNEDTPFITENDSILFFSSQGHENMGGYDIFRCRLDASGRWSAPENMRYPLNTTDDDLFFYPWHDARIVYASLIRPDGLGKEDIYAIQPADDKPLPELLTDILRPAAIAETTVMAQPESAPTVPQPAESTVLPVQPVMSPPAEPVTTPPAVQPQPVLPKEIMLKPVYFAFDNHQLTREGEELLSVVFQLMKDYPVIHIKLLGHADAKGPAEYNLVLSARRASASMQYLVNLGIDPGRLSAVGIGEKNFVAINSNPDGSDNPEGRRLNRRVEYEITGDDNAVIRINLPPVPEKLKFKE
jgi:outer membrane protein OmpA-like peptidoglycan-associated protein